MPRLSLGILVTNYNRWGLVERCVDACYRLDDGRFDSLLIYDDCSHESFAGSFPLTTRICRGSVNVGLTAALNIAVEMMGEDIVVLFDSDAYPTTRFCDEVRSMFEDNPDLGLLGLRTVGKEGQRTESYSSEPNVWSLLLGQALYAKTEKWLSDKSGRLSIFTCAMAFRNTCFQEIGGFDTNFDWLDLDNDFSMRVNRSRWQVAVAPDARIFHEGGGTAQLTRNRVLRFYKTRWYLLNKFHRISMKRLTKSLILIRLCVEYLLLQCLGTVLVRDKTILEDKIGGRRELITFCFKSY